MFLILCLKAEVSFISHAFQPDFSTIYSFMCEPSVHSFLSVEWNWNGRFA